MSTTRRQPGGWANRKQLARGPKGHALCRRCGIEVTPPRRTFCSDRCVHEWRLRTDAGYLRDQVFRRDRGICADCGTNTMQVSGALRKLNWRGRQRRCAALGIPLARLRSPWDADHIVPVAEGGGECDLSNLRTLCIPCHRRATEALRLRLRQRKVMREFGVVLSPPTPPALQS
jgi:5-methylcytosine-specific restriction endonuclease McrA